MLYIKSVQRACWLLMLCGFHKLLLRYFADLKKTIEMEKEKKEAYTMKWYIWDF